jgi:histone-lysine N-methyltransferase SUV420H
LPIGTVVKELQGSIVRLPDQWRDEMDLADDFALEPSGDEESEDEPESDDEEQTEVEDERSRQQSTATGSVQNGGPSRKGKRKNEPKGARRSGRTKRRDFSIVWSQKDRCYQLFLGPARFLNVCLLSGDS